MPRVGSIEQYIARAVRSAGTAFDRLVFLGSLRDSYNGQYLHEGWAQVASAGEVHRAVKELHRSSFDYVLGLSLIELCKQLRSHFHSIQQPERETSLLWLEAEPFRVLIPHGYSPALRELFVSNIQTALAILHRVPDWMELSGPVALPLPQPDQLPRRQWIA
jgi:hypothetical protein